MRMIHFLLTPDRASTIRLKLFLARKRPSRDVMVGQFNELLEAAFRHYLVPSQDTNWEESVLQIVESMEQAFWAKSIKVTPIETTTVIKQYYRKILEGIGTKTKWPETSKDNSERVQTRIKDFKALHERLNGLLPSDLARVGALLEKEPAATNALFSVHFLEDVFYLNQWQKAVIQKLNNDAGARRNDALAKIYKSAIIGNPMGKVKALNHLQKSLFALKPKKEKIDDSVQFISAGDHLQEVEIAAGMIQELLRSGACESQSDVAVLLPSDNQYCLAIDEVFPMAGLYPSGLNGSNPTVDHDAEFIHLFLLSLKQPAPIMATASLVRSPCCPWSREEGIEIARGIINGNFRFASDLKDSAKDLFDRIRNGAKNSSEARDALAFVKEHVKFENSMKSHALIQTIANAAIGEDVPWERLFALAAPAKKASAQTRDVVSDGVAIIHEYEESWRDSKILFVLGFNNNAYPAANSFSPVFTAVEEEEAQKIGFGIETPSNILDGRRSLFKRQLSTAEERVYFVFSNSDQKGKQLRVSTSYSFMSQLYHHEKSQKVFIREYGRKDDRRLIPGLPPEKLIPAIPLKALSMAPLDLGEDVFEILKRRAAKGKGWALAPSTMEDLLASPLGWFLGALGIKDGYWEPEQLDVLKQGTIAHKVFETIFSPDHKIPDKGKMPVLAREVIEKLLEHEYPFMTLPEWNRQKESFIAEIIRAAELWHDFMLSLNASIVAAEQRVTGVYEGLPIRGKVDMVFQVGETPEYIVVDYKKSSGKSYEGKINLGYEIQVSLYRKMVENGISIIKDGKELNLSGKPTSILYFTMNDRSILTDMPDIRAGAKTFKVRIIEGDIDKNAKMELREIIAGMKEGIIRPNSVADWDSKMGVEAKKGIRPYIFESSPLIRLFATPAEADDEDGL